MSPTEAETRIVVTRHWERGGLGIFWSKDKKDIQEISAATWHTVHCAEMTKSRFEVFSPQKSSVLEAVHM